VSILDKILAEKKLEIASKKAEVSARQLQEQSTFKPRAFVKQFLEHDKPRVIAEIKKASPSKGIICPDFEPLQIAKRYQLDGASAFSILTDEKFFQGKLEYLAEVRAANPELPILRKDFIIDPYQVSETIAAGADALLLIVSALEKPLLSELYDAALRSGLDILIEVHTAAEMETALELDLDGKKTLLGVNNRNLNNFEVSLDTTLEIFKSSKKELSTKGVSLISESGINTKEDILLLEKAGIDGFLIGESIVKDKALLAKLLG